MHPVRRVPGNERVVGGRLRVWQTTGDQLAPAALLQERPKRRAAGMRAELLVGELDLDGLTRALESDRASHRWVNRAGARRLVRFHSPPGSPPTVALFQLPRYGSGR